jgi:hypothetical protein
LLTPLKPGKGRYPNGLEFIRGIIQEQQADRRTGGPADGITRLQATLNQ